MKKRLFILLISTLLILSLAACQNEATVEGAEVAAVSPTAAPSVTPEPVVMIETTDATPAPEKDFQVLEGLIISDADVDAVLMEDVDGWEGFSVLNVEYNGQTVFYIIPEEDSLDETKAIGSVLMNYDTNRVNSVSCKVDLSKKDSNGAELEKLYDYFRDEFCFAAIGGVTEGAWQSLLSQLDMTYASAVASSQSGTESRELCGQFVYHIAPNEVSFDYYVN